MKSQLQHTAGLTTNKTSNYVYRGVIGFCALACLIIIRGPQCSDKTEVSQRLREMLDEKQNEVSPKTKRNKY